MSSSAPVQFGKGVILTLLLIFPQPNLASSTLASTTRQRLVSADFEDERLDVVLEDLGQQAAFDIVYDGATTRKVKITGSIESAPFAEALKTVTEKTLLSFTIFDKARIVHVHSQNQTETTGVIYGRILSDDTGEGLDNVNVFLANTMMGSATSQTGFFVIPQVPFGTFDLVASRLGYAVHVMKVVSRDRYNQPLLLRLTIQPFQAPEIEVSAKAQSKWEKNYSRFEKLFFSATENALTCKIMNPTVLEFTNGKNDLLLAKAIEPLIIKNHALGYKLTYVMEFFSATRGIIRTRGYSKFEEMKPHSRDQEKWWRMNREEAYHGSLRHFLATLCRSGQMLVRLPNEKVILSDGFLGDSGFEVFLTENPWQQRKVSVVSQPDILLKPGRSPHQRLLRFPNFLMVNYRGEDAEDGYREFAAQSGMPNAQISVVAMTADSVMLDTYGNIYDSSGLRVDGVGLKTFGYWSWERMADCLPWDYMQPEAENVAQASLEETETGN